MGVRTQVWGPDPCKGLTPASHSSYGPPRRRRVLWAAGAKACRRAAVVLSVRHTEEKRPAPLTGGAGSPQTKSCVRPVLSRGEPPWPFWWNPGCCRRLFVPRTAGLEGGAGQHLSVQHGMVDQAFFTRAPPGKDLRPPFLPSRLAVCLLHVVEEVTEELVPEEHKAGGEGSLQQAGGQAFEAALRTLLSQHLPGTIQEALVASHLGRGRFSG